MIYNVARHLTPPLSRTDASRRRAPERDAHIVVRDMTMAYGSFVLIQDLNFTIRRGDIFVIMGGSGCGKSTLMRQMIGLKPPARGPGAVRRRELLGRGSRGPRAADAALRHAVPAGRAVELDDACSRTSRCRSASTRTSARRRSARSPRSSWRWSGSPASRTTTPRRSAAACASARASRARWRWTPRSCSSTSPRPASTRSARACSTI